MPPLARLAIIYRCFGTYMQHGLWGEIGVGMTRESTMHKLGIISTGHGIAGEDHTGEDAYADDLELE